MKNGLKDAWGHSFYVGAAVNSSVLADKKCDELIKQHFSSLTTENSMKFVCIHPEEKVWNWAETDNVINYAKKNNLAMRGHTMVWHNQVPQWVFLDGNETVSKNLLFKRLEDHIATLTQRYGDYIYSWDVINEAIDVDKGDENNFRLSDWYKIGGKEVFEFAFKCMRQACPEAKLYYNDYNNETGKKMETTIKYISSLLDAGIPVDGIGIQGHWYYNHPNEKILKNALDSYSALGINIELTEVDVSVYEWGTAKEKADFFTSKPQDRMLEQAKRYHEIFNIASEYSSVKNITTWGLADNYTWLDDFPVKERKNWPLLFDEELNEKSVVADLIDCGNKKKTGN